MKEIASNAWKAFTQNRALFWAVTLVLGWRIGLELLHLFGALFMSPVPTQPSFLGAHDWSRWDGEWYLNIINEGYHHNDRPDGAENFAFFPLFPVLVKLLSTVLFIQPIYAGLILNSFLTIGVAYFIFGIAQQVVKQVKSRKPKTTVNPEKVGIISVIGVLLYPSSLFFAAFYVEAALILGITGAIYFALKRKLGWALLFAAIATACKSMGLVALPVVGIIILEQWYADKKPFKELVKKWALVPLGLAGLGFYMLYLWLAFGQPLLFYTAVQAWGRNNTTFFLSEVWSRYYVHLFQPDYFGWPYTYILMMFTLAMPFIVIGAGLYIAKKYRMWWPLTLAAVAVALPLSSGVMESVNRYLMVCAPLLVFLGVYLSRKPWWHTALWYVAPGLLMIYFTLQFLANGFFAG